MTTPTQTIVVVDGDRAFLELMQDFLYDEGYEAVICVGLTKAYDTIQRAAPGLVLVDLSIDERGPGWELLGRLQRNPAMAQIPLVICSTHGEFSEQYRAWLQAHRATFLEKPFTLEAMRAVVHAAIGSPVRSTRKAGGAGMHQHGAS